MNLPAPPMDALPDPPAWDERWLPMPGSHRLHLTQHGQRQGRTALLLHGGPGSGMAPLLRRGFDPAHWRLLGLDQRGAGASQPAGGLAANSTDELLADLRRLRAQLGVPRWLVVGGSWGATLAVAHAADQPDAVAGLLLRGAFLARPADIDAFFSRHQAPDAAAQSAWDRLAEVATGALGNPAQPVAPRALLQGLARVLAQDPAVGAAGAQPRACAAAWWAWEQALAGQPPGAEPPDPTHLDALVQRYRVQAHYLVHDCWLAQRPLLDRAAACPPVPTLLLHGSADRICPPAGARALQAALPQAALQLVPGAGHDPSHPAMAAAMRAALASFAAHGHFGAAATVVSDPCRCA